ncbi:hypothetical protein D9M73_269210 [compost metagenome]
MPMRFHCGDLHRLVLERVQAVHIADQNLHRHRQRRECHRRDQHLAAGFHMHTTAQIPRAHATNHKTRGDERT